MSVRAALRTMLLCLCYVISACANYGLDKHFDRSDLRATTSQESASSPSSSEPIEQDDPSRAIVFYVRDRAFMQSLIYVPIPPAVFAVDGKVTSVMPLGSYVKLSLEPGRHFFKTYHYVNEFGWLHGYDLNLEDDLQAGRTYYVVVKTGFPRYSLVTVEEKEGRKIVESAEKAKFVHAPVTTTVFEARLEEMKKGGKKDALSAGGAAPAGPSLQDRMLSALPSKEQVTNTLEGIAAIALLAVAIVGGVALIGLAGGFDSTPPPVTPLRPPVALAAQSPSHTRLMLSSGGLLEASERQGETNFYNPSTGTRYRVEGERIFGTDGSRYRVSGTQIYSDTGASYTVVGGKFVYAPDGSNCTLIGSQILCQRGR